MLLPQAAPFLSLLLLTCFRSSFHSSLASPSLSRNILRTHTSYLLSTQYPRAVESGRRRYTAGLLLSQPVLCLGQTVGDRPQSLILFGSRSASRHPRRGQTGFPSSPDLILPLLQTGLASLSRPSVASTWWMAAALIFYAMAAASDGPLPRDASQNLYAVVVSFLHHPPR
jgi:hypothetical protein